MIIDELRRRVMYAGSCLTGETAVIDRAITVDKSRVVLRLMRRKNKQMEEPRQEALMGTNDDMTNGKGKHSIFSESALFLIATISALISCRIR